MASFYNPNEGTWLIKGSFDKSSILVNSGIETYAHSGDGVVVVTYDSNGSAFYSGGELQYTGIPPSGADGSGVIIAKDGVARVANTLFIPRKMSDSEARNAAIGNVALDQAGTLVAQLYGNGEQGAMLIPQPTLLGNQNLWQMSDGTVIVDADGDPVGRNDDASGNGNHATQSVSADRPLYEADGSLHCLVFDGAGDYLSSSIDALQPTPSGFTVSFVVYRSTLNLHGSIVGIYEGATRFFCLGSGRLALSAKNTNGETFSLSGGGTLAPDTYYVVSVTYDAATGDYKLYKDSVEVASHNDPVGFLYPSSGYLRIGHCRVSTHLWHGGIGAGVIVSKYLPPSSRLRVENYLAKLAGVSL